MPTSHQHQHKDRSGQLKLPFKNEKHKKKIHSGWKCRSTTFCGHTTLFSGRQICDITMWSRIPDSEKCVQCLEAISHMSYYNWVRNGR